MIKHKKKKCKGTGKAKGYGCGKETFFRTYGLCKSCYADWLLNSEYGKEKIRKSILKSQKQREKEQRKKLKEQKEKIKTSRELQSEIQVIINKIVRLIDAPYPCISCKNETRQMHAGHYHSVGSNLTLRFHLDNIHKQCVICNNYKSANSLAYKKGLEERYGKEYADFVNDKLVQIEPRKFSIEELREIKKKALQIKKDILNGKDWDRQKINKFLGIYKVYYEHKNKKC